MSCKELIESLRKAADQRIKQIWSDAEAEAGAVKADVGRRLDQLREELARKQDVMTRDRMVRAVSEANRRARLARLGAEKDILDRLYSAAEASLAGLRDRSYPERFAGLIRELPPLAWDTVRVNPADLALAKKHFPGVAIAADVAISGGMDVSTKNGAVRVINTFEKRLERAWSEMQPLLIREVYGEVTDETAAAAGGPGISGRISSGEDKRQTVTADR
jgi:V/A-type H+-transporting ATPase subunit E